MRVSAGSLEKASFLLCVLFSLPAPSVEQTPTHIELSNPTPRQPDLKQVYGDTPEEQKKQQELSLQGQLNARDIWLESNQILLLAQQLQQDVLSRGESTSMQANAAKAAQIEKLAKTMREKMKAH